MSKVADPMQGRTDQFRLAEIPSPARIPDRAGRSYAILSGMAARALGLGAFRARLVPAASRCQNRPHPFAGKLDELRFQPLGFSK
jgi:hypothetical protein